VTLYNPVAAVVAFVIDGFCAVELKLFGPVHAYVAPDTSVAVRFNVDPSQTGPPLPAVGAAGIALTVTVTCELTIVNPSLTSTLYIVVTNGVAVGFVPVDENPDGFDVHT
jgi:hypothetical protein